MLHETASSLWKQKSCRAKNVLFLWELTKCDFLQVIIFGRAVATAYPEEINLQPKLMLYTVWMKIYFAFFILYPKQIFKGTLTQILKRALSIHLKFPSKMLFRKPHQPVENRIPYITTEYRKSKFPLHFSLRQGQLDIGIKIMPVYFS